MEELAYETQYCLDTWEPDQVTTLTHLGGNASAKTHFIPVRPAMLRWWTANKYNLKVSGVPDTLAPPPAVKPTGRLQIAIYRSILPVFPYSVGINIATMVPGTYYDSGTLAAATGSLIQLDFQNTVLALGGSYWIVIRFSDLTTSGANLYTWNYEGFGVADTNLTHTILYDSTTTGTLPTDYISTDVVVTPGNHPWMRADLV